MRVVVLSLIWTLIAVGAMFVLGAPLLGWDHWRRGERGYGVKKAVAFIIVGIIFLAVGATCRAILPPHSGQ